MLDLTIFNSKCPDHFDHQATGTFGECERMAFYQLQLGRRKKELSLALDWGGAYHACIDAILIEPDIEKAIGEVEKIVFNQLLEDPEDRYGRNRARMWEVMHKWVEWNHVNPIKILRSEQPTIIKCSSGEGCPYFTEGCGLEYGGIMDAIVEWNGYIGPMDRKTTVMTDKDPVNEFRLSHQMMGYIWICSHLQGRHCWGAIVERCITNKSKIEFNRFPVSTSRALIQEWVENEKVLQADFRYKAENYPHNEIAWRQNRARCWEPYACQYRDVCLAPREQGYRARMLLDRYAESRWDFMNRDAEKEIKK